MEIQVTRWGEPALRWLVGGLFATAGTLKALDPAAFVQAIGNYQLLPQAAAVALAFYLPWLEIFCGLSLVLKRLQTGALALLGGLTLVFIAALLSAWGRGLNIECGCFGAGDGAAHYGTALGRDFVLLAALGWLWRRQKDGLSMTSNAGPKTGGSPPGSAAT